MWTAAETSEGATRAFLDGRRLPPPRRLRQEAEARSKVVEATPAPTEKDISDAKSKGMVWVNTNTKVCHTDGQFHGKTKKGKFMAEDDAKKAGFKAAQEPVAKKTKADVKK